MFQAIDGRRGKDGAETVRVRRSEGVNGWRGEDIATQLRSHTVSQSLLWSHGRTAPQSIIFQNKNVAVAGNSYQPVIVDKIVSCHIFRAL